VHIKILADTNKIKDWKAVPLPEKKIKDEESIIHKKKKLKFKIKLLKFLNKNIFNKQVSTFKQKHKIHKILYNNNLNYNMILLNDIFFISFRKLNIENIF